METNSGIIHYVSKKDSLNRVASPLKSVVGSIFEDSKTATLSDASKVELSDKAKNLGKSLKKKGKDLLKNQLKGDKSELKQAGKRLLMDAGSVAVKALTQLPSLSLPDISLSTKESSPIKEIIDKKVFSKSPQRAGLYFLTGLNLKTLSGNDGGIEDMASFITDAEQYSWKDEGRVLEEISKKDADQPIVLVGHSLGGDAVVNIANKLNSIQHGFRKIDLLVTMDSVGFDNDIIPENVRKNMNFISDQDMFFNDGPNIARNNNLTEVINELRSEGHREMDNASEIQLKVYDTITKIVKAPVKEA